jgi:hypothetical protein
MYAVREERGMPDVDAVIRINRCTEVMVVVELPLGIYKKKKKKKKNGFI